MLWGNGFFVEHALQSFSVVAFFLLNSFNIIFEKDFLYFFKCCLFITSSEIITFFNRWDFLLKVWIWYQYQNKIEKHYHHDQEKLLRFYKKVHIRTYRLSKKKGFLAKSSFYFLRRAKMYYEKGRIAICLFDKSCTQNNVNYDILHEISWLRWIVIEQVN